MSASRADRGARHPRSVGHRAPRGRDRTFFTILRRWYAENRNGNVTTDDFIALSERVSGRQLDDFFEVWLYEDGKPESW